MSTRFESRGFFDALARLSIPSAFSTDSGRCNHWDNHWARMTCILQHWAWSVDARRTAHGTVWVHVEGTIPLACHFHISIVRLLDYKVVIKATLLQTLRKFIAQTWFPWTILSAHQLVVRRLSKLVSVLYMFMLSQTLFPARLTSHTTTAFPPALYLRVSPEARFPCAILRKRSYF
jgi:hypothetical protein